MSRAGDEMILGLAGLLGTETVKTAAKKDDEKEEKAKDKKEEKKDDDDKEDKKEDDDKEDKKASVMMGVIQDLVKLANDLDEAGAEEASGLVDDALKAIVDSVEKTDQVP